MTADVARPVGRIEELWSDHRELIKYLREDKQVQFLVRAEESFSKTLLIAAASYFEVQLCAAIVGLYGDPSDGTDVLAQFVVKQGINRRFSQMFDWGDSTRSARNANRFYGLFGSDFSNHMKKRVLGDRRLDEAVQAFLELGNLRNQMVHGNYADFQLGKNVEEVYSLYEKARYFVSDFPLAVQEFTETSSSNKVSQ